jgi:succinoglycan biosynthesis protein ExoO
VVTPVRVSIIIAAYDAAATIARAVESVLDQSIADLEVLVADDASIDDTAGIVGRLAQADPRVRLIRLGRNGGPAAARNAALAQAKGAWIAILDADDWFAAADRLERMLEVAAREDVDLVADNLTLSDAQTQAPLGPAFPFAPTAPPVPISTVGFIESNALTSMRLGFGYLKPIIRARLISDHALRYPDDLRVGEDYAFYLQCLIAGGRWLLLPAPMYAYSMTPGSTSRQITRHDLVALVAQNEALLALPDLGGPDVRQALLRRGRDLGDAMAHFDCIGDLKNGRMVAVALCMARHPRVVVLLTESVRQATLKRLGLFGRSTVRQAPAIRGGRS